MADTPGDRTTALTRLTAVSRALTYAASLEEVLDISVESAAELLGARAALLMLTDGDGLLRIRASRGLAPSMAKRFHGALDERLAGRLADALGADSPDLFLGVPLVVRGGVTGLLAVLREAPGPVEERDEWLLSALADQASVALESARDQQARVRLEDRVGELERLSSTREDALRIIGHDLRSPLSAMLGYVQMLAAGMFGQLTDVQRERLSRVESIGRHLAALLDMVRDMGALAAGELEAECAPLRLEPVVDEAVEIVALDAGEAGMHIRAVVPEGLVVRANRDRLRQVLVHLLDNAVKYGRPDTEVAVAVAVTTGAGPARAEIRVSDEGPGIPPDQLEAVFEPYHRLPGTASAKPGVGLGLPLARALVEIMGGTLVAEPRDDGATFLIRLPVA